MYSLNKMKLNKNKKSNKIINNQSLLFKEYFQRKIKTLKKRIFNRYKYKLMDNKKNKLCN